MHFTLFHSSKWCWNQMEQTERGFQSASKVAQYWSTNRFICKSQVRRSPTLPVLWTFALFRWNHSNSQVITVCYFLLSAKANPKSFFSSGGKRYCSTGSLPKPSSSGPIPELDEEQNSLEGVALSPPMVTNLPDGMKVVGVIEHVFGQSGEGKLYQKLY